MQTFGKQCRIWASCWKWIMWSDIDICNIVCKQMTLLFISGQYVTISLKFWRRKTGIFYYVWFENFWHQFGHFDLELISCSRKFLICYHPPSPPPPPPPPHSPSPPPPLPPPPAGFSWVLATSRFQNLSQNAPVEPTLWIDATFSLQFWEIINYSWGRDSKRTEDGLQLPCSSQYPPSLLLIPKCMYVYMYVWMYASMYKCIPKCMSVWMYKFTKKWMPSPIKAVQLHHNILSHWATLT